MPNSVRLETVQGFTVARLANAQVEIAVVPALGAKLLSLQSLDTGREWLWRPPGPPRLFRNLLGDDFTRSTLIGADECLPTIGACTVGGRELPDHGEAWSASWTLDETAIANCVIRTSLRLPCSPFTLTRTATLVGASVVFDYTLINHATERQPFLWALHPLFTVVEGDRVHLPSEVRWVRVESARQYETPHDKLWEWPKPQHGVDLQTLTLGNNAACVKVFAGPLLTGAARIENLRTGDCLEIRWPVECNPFVGLWLTRGGWLNAHHYAIEPTNAPCDALDAALLEAMPSLFVDAGETRRWSVMLDLTPVAI
jgi:galactose mutarotase-like enzyme